MDQTEVKTMDKKTFQHFINVVKEKPKESTGAIANVLVKALW